MQAEKIISFWDINFAASGDKSLITGSPNRTETRFLFRDSSNVFYIAEGYNINKKNAQIRQNTLLEFLKDNHLGGIAPFYRTRTGEHGVQYENLFWQIRPYIPAEKVDRAELGSNENYGILWGNFLLQLKNLIAAGDPPPPMPNAPFYMANFLPRIMRFAAIKMPAITGKLREFEKILTPFFKWERTAGSMFAHGDFHPGNILTAGNKIQVVIDWEFAGLKFPGYDMALLIGCLGMDDPANFSSPAVIALQNTLYKNGYLPSSAWDLLPMLIAATRLGWLGEWLNLGEESLIYQELELLSILLRQ